MIICINFIEAETVINMEPVSWMELVELNDKQIEYMQQYAIADNPFHFTIPEGSRILDYYIVQPPQTVEQLWTVYLD